MYSFLYSKRLKDWGDVYAPMDRIHIVFYIDDDEICDMVLIPDPSYYKSPESHELKKKEAELRYQAIVSIIKEQFDAYFDGKLKEFSFPYSTKGTLFQLSVWEELSKIPYGETASYSDIAMRLGKAKSYRAVGMANHENPLPILIPCHRVIGKDGKLTGYAYGLELKAYLLELERIHRK